MDDEKVRELVTAIRKVYVPEGDVVLVDANRPKSILIGLNPLYQQLIAASREQGPSVHICQGSSCGMPLKTPEQIAEALKI